jgi:antitoxin YefM
MEVFDHCLSEEEWRGIQETLYLMSIPGMRESIIEGMNTPAEKMDEDPGW